MIRQLARAHEQAVALVESLEVHHGLAAVAALAVHVLEQVQRQRAGAVEQQHVALLQIVEIAGGDLFQEALEAVAVPLRQACFRIERRAHLRDGGLQLCRRVGKQRREHLQGLAHHATSIGVLAFLGPPNRLVSVRPSEQPLPNEKPHEPLRS